MKPIDPPSMMIHVATRDHSADELHYSIVQVSAYRYVVVEYHGHGIGWDSENRRVSVPEWKTVSKPMKYAEAVLTAADLTKQRVSK